MNPRGKISVILAIGATLFTAYSLSAQSESAAPVLLAKFAGNLNTKSAKVGDAIAAKTTKAAKLKDGTDVPKGSKIDGKVIAVQSAKDGNGTSSLAIKFDQAEVKGSAPVPIQGLIVSIAPSADAGGGGLGFNSVLSRGGTGSTPALDPNTGAEHGGAANGDIPKGSTLEGVALGTNLDAQAASELRGIKRDIKLDPDVLIKVELE
ncbi:MAG: hypothetical protein WBE76_13325 [Terracidiphilus sp.]